ncbi:uroporphyrinogen-III C-methyltransferase [Ureibacillus sinduriensis]|uniref:Uroporphyrinogen-III C-methyltransferase n=1 Tax=Ureibacillus sinduriensis BLB-1 = JCM 15800 TaxID=1384057 RepID=A0A0A3IGU1_9BACL|nr:uroporphyrinogen-III C-methyltransferase [Ureibacillus sinduriensis]KGR74057.1 uroporphyrin-III methyltransferase [Ureibacillus sinduriensis BLB-1 = JCM 15800]
MTGKVYLVGAGPGDPKLITVYGLECIKNADVIAYDRLVNKELLKNARETAELVYCGKEPGRHGLIQEEIHELLVKEATNGKMVVRLKGGDPFVFGRGAEEAAVLKAANIPYEVVPGITAGIAAAAYAGIPVTHRDYATSFAIVTGHGRAEKGNDFLHWEALANGIDTIAFYMSVGNIRHIAGQLIAHGRDKNTSVAIIERGTTENQRTITSKLESIADRIEQEKVVNPALIIVGDVVDVREKIAWFEQMEETIR